MRPKALWLGILVVLAGCGGGGGDSQATPDGATPRIPIVWGERSREVAVPSAALSIAVILRRGGPDDKPHTFVVDRTGAIASHREELVGPERLPIGTYEVSMNFHSGRQATGTVVGRAWFTGRLSATGQFQETDDSPLGEIQTEGLLTQLCVPGKRFKVGEEAQIPVSARTKDGQILALSEGSAIFRGVGEASDFVARDGRVRTDRPFSGGVDVTLDGLKAGAPLTVFDREPIVLNLDSYAVASDRSSGYLYLATSELAGSQRNRLLEIDAETGVTKRWAQFDSPLDGVFVARSRSIAYLRPANRLKIIKFDLRTFTTLGEYAPNVAGAEYPLVNEIVISPYDPNVFSYGLTHLPQRPSYQLAVRSGDHAPVFGTFRPSSWAWTAPDRLYVVQWSRGLTAWARVGADRIERTELETYFSTQVVRVGDRLVGYLNNALVLADLDTAAVIKRIPLNWYEGVQLRESKDANAILLISGNGVRKYLVESGAEVRRIAAGSYREQVVEAGRNDLVVNSRSRTTIYTEWQQ